MRVYQKRLLILGIVLVATLSLLIGLEIFATNQVERIASQALMESMDLKNKPDVKVSSRPIIVKLILGRIDSLEISAKDVPTTIGITISELSVDIKELEFKPRDWVTRRRLIVEDIDEANVELMMSEKEVNKYLAKVLPDSRVELEDDNVNYKGIIVDILGVTLEYTINGKIVLEDSNKVKFIPNIEAINQLNAPQEVRDYLLEVLTVDYQIPGLPGGFEIESVKTKPNELIINGSLDEFDFNFRAE